MNQGPPINQGPPMNQGPHGPQQGGWVWQGQCIWQGNQQQGLHRVRTFRVLLIVITSRETTRLLIISRGLLTNSRVLTTSHKNGPRNFQQNQGPQDPPQNQFMNHSSSKYKHINVIIKITETKFYLQKECTMTKLNNPNAIVELKKLADKFKNSRKMLLKEVIGDFNESTSEYKRQAFIAGLFLLSTITGGLTEYQIMSANNHLKDTQSEV